MTKSGEYPSKAAHVQALLNHNPKEDSWLIAMRVGVSESVVHKVRKKLGIQIGWNGVPPKGFHSRIKKEE